MNRINCINNNLIYKRYDISEKCLLETNAIKALSNVIPEYIPDLYLNTNNLCVFRYYEGNEVVSYNTKVEDFIVGITSDIYFKYRNNKTKVTKWKEILIETTTKFKNNQKCLTLPGERKLFRNILFKLQMISIDKDICKNITFLHRDIHLGNILIPNDTYKLIDFEHACYGPVELEFQNSIFWGDRKSIDYKSISKKLINRGIPYIYSNEVILMDFYIADQINMAIELGDMNKLMVLIRLSRKFVN